MPGITLPTERLRKRLASRREIASKAGQAGTGESKQRSPEHYKRIAARARSKNLDPQKIREIRASKLTCRQLAMKHNVSPSLIARIKSGERWGDVK